MGSLRRRNVATSEGYTNSKKGPDISVDAKQHTTEQIEGPIGEIS
jgi:hypothetical protein